MRSMIIAKPAVKKILLNLYDVPEKCFIDCPDRNIGFSEEINLQLEATDAILLAGTPWDFENLYSNLVQSGLESKLVSPNDPFRQHKSLLKYGSKHELKDLAYRSIYDDTWHRHWYAFPLIVAVAEAERLKLRELTVVEMGVWHGEGLLNMASICALLSECTGIGFRVIGFDAATGLPSVADYRDHPELWHTGDLASPDIDKLKAKLPGNCELVIGDISKTIDTLVAELTPSSPLAFMALDVDTYSSSVEALRVFKHVDPSCLLPATPIYVDDGYINIMQNDYCGEGLAINEFNQTMPLRKILQKIVRTDRFPKPWHHVIHFCHVFDHPVRTSHQGVSFIGLNVHSL